MFSNRSFLERNMSQIISKLKSSLHQINLSAAIISHIKKEDPFEALLRKTVSLQLNG